MNQSFIDKLIAFLSTPYGVIGVGFGILMVFRAARDRPTGWLLLSLCLFASSLDTFRSQWMPIPPALLFPLQQLRPQGRPIAIVLLILLLFAALQTPNNWRRDVRPPAVKYLMYVQFVIFSKTILYGSQEFAMLSALTFGGILVMMRMGPGRWLQNDENFHLAVRSIAMAGGIFIIANTYQFILGRYAITFAGGRFLGTTGNPQAAGLLLAVIIPCLMFLIQGSPRWNFAKSCWTGILLMTLYFLLLTGSRTGIMMGVVSILLFYRNNGGAWLRIMIFLGILTALIWPFLQPESLSAASTGIDSSVSDRFTSINNTREGVWNGLLDIFLNNILFGAPLVSDRMGYGESSWLAAGANLGLLGFIPMLIMGWESLKLMWRLNQLGNRQKYYFYQSSVIIAGLGSTLIGSFFEAILLGNITFLLLTFILYLYMGGYLLEVDRARSYYDMSEVDTVDQTGVYQ